MSLEMFITQAKSLGRRAAEARHKKDESLAGFFRESLVKIKRVMPKEERQQVEVAYTTAYREEAQSYMQPVPFR
jgi:hypothetical protein